METGRRDLPCRTGETDRASCLSVWGSLLGAILVVGLLRKSIVPGWVESRNFARAHIHVGELGGCGGSWDMIVFYFTIDPT